MRRYNRRYTSPNTSKSVYWITVAAVVAYIVYRVIEFKRNVDRVHKMEMKEN